MSQASNRINMRLTDLEKADWTEAAGGARLLSQWIRATCNAACIADRRARLPEGIDPPYEQHLESLGIPVANAKPAIVEAAIAEAVEKDQAHRESRSLSATGGVRSDDSSASAARTAPGGGRETCPRWMHHRPGVYCGACKRVQK